MHRLNSELREGVTGERRILPIKDNEIQKKSTKTTKRRLVY